MPEKPGNIEKSSQLSPTGNMDENEVPGVSIPVPTRRTSLTPSRRRSSFMNTIKPKNEDNNHTGSRQLSLVGSNTFLGNKFYHKIADAVQTRYYELVSFRQECYLMLLYLIPLLLVMAILLTLGYYVFETKATAWIAKIGIVLLGVAVTHLNDTLNSRHGRLLGMADIINGTACLKTVCDTVAGNRKSVWFHYITIIFYAALIATDLSLTTKYVSSYHGSGVSLKMVNNIDPKTLPTYPGLLMSAVGSQFACADCGGLKSLNVLLVPVSSKLQDEQPTDVSIDLIESTIQDVLSVEASCIDSIPSIDPLKSGQIKIDISEFEYGIGACMFTMEFSSFVNVTSNIRKSKQCTVVVREFSGMAVVRYRIAPSGLSVRKAVESIESSNPKTCIRIGETCLDLPIRSSLSTILTKMIFFQQSYSFNQRLAYTSNLVPDPSEQLSDRIFEDTVQKMIANALIIAGNLVPSEPRTVVLFNDTEKVKLLVSPWLLVVTIIFGCLAAIMPMMLISTDLIRIKKSPDNYLRLLYERLKPGKEFLEDTAVLCSNPRDGYYLAHLRYGEDRRTVSNALGVLRFGLKSEIVKFKENRAYY